MGSNHTCSLPGTFRCRRLLPLVLLVAGLGLQSHAGQPTAMPANVFSADQQTLADSKAALHSGSTAINAALNRLLKDAGVLLNQKPSSVMEKQPVPPSGDKHDYLSQAPYYWRDTNSPDEKYVRRDGERNPESNTDSDAGRLGK